MSELRKLIICPWFGPLPNWMLSFTKNWAMNLQPHGYDLHIDQDLDRFKRLTRQLLGVEFPGEPGGSKIHDFRATLGVIYGDEIVDGRYDFWGHVDFDCLFGRVDRFVTDEFLADLDVHSNHDSYICGPWTLYRDSEDLAWAFTAVDGWKDQLADPRTTGWVETSFSRGIEQGFRYAYTMWQTRDWNRFDDLSWGDDGTLYEGTVEIFMAHFRRLNPKVYPEQCRL